MPIVHFTSNLARHLPVPTLVGTGETVRDVLDTAFSDHGLLRSYVLDEQGRVRTHVSIYLDGVLIGDRRRLSDAVQPDSEIYVLQALSGG